MGDKTKFTADVLREQLAYSDWANRRIIGALVSLTDEELTRDFQTSDHSVLGTLVHIFAADRVWLDRVRGKTPGPFLDPAREMKLSTLQNDWPRVLDEWKAWAAALTDDEAESAITYRDMAGKEWQSRIGEIVFHLVSHATHHRGQAIGFLRTMGHTPPVTGMIAFYRGL